MSIKKIMTYDYRPILGASSTSKFWDDPHISTHMMEAHLNPQIDSATRNHLFVKKSAAWIASALPSSEHPTLLDLGCGPGLYAEQFHTHGYQVTGIDLSEGAIVYAKESAKAKNLAITYTVGSYLDMSYDNAFEVATLIYCDYGALNKENRNQLLQRIYQALKPGGKLLLDVFTLAQYEGKEESKSWTSADNGFWTNEPHLCLNSFYRYDEYDAFLEQYIVATESRVECYNIWDHVFTKESLQEELANNGFTAFQFYGDVAGAATDSKKPTLCIICEKP